MKRHGIILCVLLAVTIITVNVATICLCRAQNDVIFTQETLWGDPSEAHGLDVTVYAQLDDRLFWTSQYDLSHNRTVTDFTYGSSSVKAPQEVNRGIEFTKAIWSDNFYDAQGEPLGYAKAMDGILEELPMNETRLVWYRIQDHFTYYPICWSELQIDLPTKDSYTLRSSLQEVAEALHSYLRIPVLDEAYTIRCTKSEGGYSVSRNENDFPSGDFFDFLCINAVTDSACYFTFSTRSSGNATVDTSQIPGGYGIFCLPYSYDKSKVMADELSTVYPLDPNVQVIELTATSDQTHLLLTTLEDDACLLRIINIESMTSTAEFTLCQWDASHPPQTKLICTDNSIICEVSGNSFTVISRNEYDKFSLEFSVETAHDVGTWDADKADYKFNGEKVAIVYPCQEQYSDYTVEGCGFCVAVYDQTGLLYNGRYSNSLNIADDQKLFELWNVCTLNKDSEQLSINWSS